MHKRGEKESYGSHVRVWHAIPRAGDWVNDEAEIAHVERREHGSEHEPELAEPATEVQRAAKDREQEIVRHVAEVQVLDERAPREQLAQRDSGRRLKYGELHGLDRVIVVAGAYELIESRYFCVQQRKRYDWKPIAHDGLPSASVQQREHADGDDDT